jgi:cyclopropane-fatty-acyl-phospholipid synthase
MPDNSLASPGSTARSRLLGAPIGRLFDKVLLRTLDDALRQHGAGRLILTLPSGETASLGRPGPLPDLHIGFGSYRSLWRALQGGALGFAEGYMDGDIAVDDLQAVFRFYFANESALTAGVPALLSSRGRDKLLHARRRNTRSGSRRNIAAHYDLGNDFYRLWLDASMLYSSGIFASGDTTLEQAQAAKTERIMDALEIEPGHSLLEIGCGWGALAIAAARHGAQVDAITISAEQLAEARSRIAAAGLEQRAAVRFEDYRDTTGSYDRLVSIEMIEAVGEENWPLFFETIARRLRPRGVGVIQAITIREDAFELYRRNPDFIQRYIFPGGMLPTVTLMRERAMEAGLVFEEVERFGRSYACTLRAWRQRFDLAWPRIEALGFDNRFRRMWEYYLTYCEAGFKQGLIDVGLYRLRNPGRCEAL